MKVQRCGIAVSKFSWTRRRPFTGVLLALGLISGISAQTITTITAVHRLSTATAIRGLPVLADGIVTNVGGWPYGLTVQDGNDGIYVALVPGAPRVEVGQRVTVTGTTNEGRFAPTILAGRIKVKGQGSLPKPYAAHARELSSGELDNRLVEVRGVVRATAPGTMGDKTGIFMVVDMNPGTVHVAVAPGIALDATKFVDASIRASGVVGVEFNKRRQALGASLVVNRLQDITIVHPPSANALSGPPTPIADIFRWGSNQDWSHRIKVNGVLTLQRPGEFLILQDRNQAIRVESLDTAVLPIGTRFDAAGFAIPAQAGPMLADAVVGARGWPEALTPLFRKAAQVSLGDDNWLLIRLRAKLIEIHEAGTGVALTLEDDGTRFVADAPGAAARELEHLTLGSRLELTGINEVMVDALRQPLGFKLLIRSPKDVVVLSAGPWLNAGRVLWTALALAAVALLCALWALTLRTRVRSQTAWISESLRREKSAASLQSERSRILELVGRNAPLPMVCDGLIRMISLQWPLSLPGIGIRFGEKWEWHGHPESRRSDLPVRSIDLTSSSGALHATVVLSIGGTCPASGAEEHELLQVCRECLSIALEHHDLHARLLQQSLSDPLTQLPNRRSLDAHMERALETAREKRTRCAILVMDMDGFKSINDTLGHAAGDIVLQELGKRFNSVMRKNEMIARIGGDEFVAVLENLSGSHEAHEIAARLAAQAAIPVDVGGIVVNPSLSVGIAIYPSDGENGHALKNFADTRMYRAKMTRGRRHIYESECVPAGLPFQ